ncbi:MAG: hypothetical protein JXN64_07945 [Spirochaetes bacterium]|nr:hypothetical protein [Spirochaetota bacterium]
MKIINRAVLVLVYMMVYIPSSLGNEPSDTASIPVYYPEEAIGSASPYFIWYDLYNERDSKDNVEYRITLKPGKGQDIKPVLVTPALYEKYYYYFKWPFPLEPDKYAYTIERLSDMKPSNVKYFHYLKYPVKGEFGIDPEENTVKDSLPPDRLIEYIRLEKENRLVNRNNFFFYSSASAGAFGIGLLFYKVLHFGIISKIVYYIAFTSSAVGAGAAGYYGVNYFIERCSLHKIADIGKNVSVNGAVSANAMRVDFEMRY